MALSNYLNQGITITPFNTYNEYGEPSYGTSFTSKARFEDVREIVTATNGEEVQSTGRFFVLPSVNVNKDDKVTYDGVDYRVFEVYRGYRRTQNWHLKLFVQRWEQ